MSKCIIRAARKEDIEDISRLENANFTDAWSENAFLGCLESPYSNLVVAEYAGEVVGYACLFHMYEIVNLDNICVDNEYRRLGIATDLLMHFKESLATEDVEYIFLEVRESNTAAKAFYEKEGFETYHIQEGGYSHPRENAIKMRLSLDRFV